MATDEADIGAMKSHVKSINQRLERVEGRTELMSERLNLIHERLDVMDARFTQRFDDLEKLIRNGMNGHGG